MDMDMDKKDNPLRLKDIETGESMTVLSEEKRKSLLRDMQKFYTVTVDYLRKKRPLTQNVVKYAQCLHPEVRDQNTAMRYVRSQAEEMPDITPNKVAIICDEWKVYRVEEIENSVMYDNDDKLKIVDHFWKEVLSRKSASGNQQFPTLQKLVNSSLPSGQPNIAATLY
ncbi:hypothetical protein DPMN_037725 [Dreissena polymorpha]|uniref:Uncharacterized protein n=1 Tax=Dreissena polymorpha TaxID=45954 RepID=A0A9D4ME39_DREPO|nr:hypothetical protein DPMN_037725 [Dreissena polymorpha]